MHNIDTCFCYENNDCYYKQLKRLEAETAELKEELAILKDLYSGATPQRYVKYKQKLEKIEKVILRCKEANCTNCEYQDKCNFNGDDFDDYILRIVRGEE